MASGLSLLSPEDSIELDPFLSAPLSTLLISENHSESRRFEDMAQGDKLLDVLETMYCAQGELNC